jgi:hypothetical protein
MIKLIIQLLLAVLLLLVIFFGGCFIIAMMVEGIYFLPAYIGGFGTFMLYVSLFTIVFCVIYNYKNNTK